MTAFSFDDVYLPWVHDRPDDLGPDDRDCDDDEGYPMSMWAPNTGEWLDA